MIILSDSYYTEVLDDREFYKTQLVECNDGEYRITQDQNPTSVGTPLCSGQDYVLLTKEQAIDIAKTILRNEGITCLV